MQYYREDALGGQNPLTAQDYQNETRPATQEEIENAGSASWQAGYRTLLQQMGAIQGKADVYKNASPLSADTHMQNIAKSLAKDYGITSIGDIGIRQVPNNEMIPIMGGIGDSEYIAGYEPAGGTIPEYFNKNDPTKIIPGYKFASENRGDGYSEYNLQPMPDGKGGTIALPVQQYSKSGLGAFAQDIAPIIPIVNLALMANGVPPLYVAAGNVAFQAGAGNIKDIGDVLRTAAPIMAGDPGIVGGVAKLYTAYQAFDQGNVVSGLASIASAGGFNETAIGLRFIDAVKTGNVPGALMTLGQMRGVGDYQFKDADGKPLVGSDGKPVTLSTFKVGGENGFTLPELSKAATIATTLMSDNPDYGLALQLSGELKNSPDTVMAGRAASLVQQLSSPNPNPTALYSAALGLAQTTNAKAPGSAPIDDRSANAAVRVAAGDTGNAEANAIMEGFKTVGQNVPNIKDGLTVADLGTKSDATITDNSIKSRLTPAQLQQLEENGFYVDENGDTFDENGTPIIVKIDIGGVNSEATDEDFEAPTTPKTRSLNSFSLKDFANNNDVLISDLGVGNTENQLTPEQIRLLTTANNNDVLISDLGMGTTIPITGGPTTGNTDTKATTSTDTKGGTTTTSDKTVSDLYSMDAKRGATGDTIYTDKLGNSYYVDDDGDVQSLTKEQANTLLTTATAEDTGRSLDRVTISGKYEDPGLDYPWNNSIIGETLARNALNKAGKNTAGLNLKQLGDELTKIDPSTVFTVIVDTPYSPPSTLPTDKITTLTTDKITTLTTDTITTLPTTPITTLPPPAVIPTTAPPAITTIEPRGLQALPTSEARYWRQTGAKGTGGQGGVRFFDWYDTPENRTMAPDAMATADIPAITSQQATSIAAPRPKQYYNSQTNQYYTDPTGTWQPPAGWVQTNLKGGGKVENLSSGGTTKPRNTSIVGETLARDFLKKAGVNTTGLSLKQLEAELARLNPGEVFTITGNTTTTPGTTTSGTTTSGTTTSGTTTGGTTIPVTTTGGTTAPRNTSIVDVNLARNALKKAGVNTTGLSLKQLEVELARIYPTEMFTVTPSTKNKLETKEDIEANRQILNKALEGFVDYGDYKPDIRLRPDEVATVLRANGIDPYGLSASDMLDALHKVVGVGKSYGFESVNIADLESYFDTDKISGDYIFRETRKPYTGPTSHASSQTTGTTGGTTGGTTTAPPARTTTQALGLQTLLTSNARTIFPTQNISALTTASTPALTTAQISALTTASTPALTTTPAPAVAAPTAKQYFNQSTNRYYTDPTGTWQPPAGWTQTGLKGGGEVNTNFYDGGYADFDIPVDSGGGMPDEDVYRYLRSLPADNSWDSSPSDYGFNFDLGDLTYGFDEAEAARIAAKADAENVNNIRWDRGDFGDPEDPRNENYGNEGRAYSGRNAIDPITGSPVNAITGSPTKSSSASNVFKQLSDAAKKNPDLMKMLLAAGLGGLIGYAGRPKGIKPMGMQGLGLSQGQVYGALKGTPVQRAEGGEIDGYAGGGGLHYLKSAEDGMADKIPATIDNKQPAKLSGGEFVIPADVVSHLGNGNSEAGAKQLYAMMDRIRHARTGNKKQGKQINPAKFTPK